MRNFTKTALLLSTVLAAIPINSARAQEAVPADDPAGTVAATSYGDEIIVTAQKREENLKDVPMSIFASSGDQLRSLGVMGPADLAKIVSGFTFNYSAYGAPVFTIRGVGFQDTALAASPTVSVYVDEITRPFSIEAVDTSLDIARVEVLKGPQGTLYGQNATGGAINYVTNKPTDTLGAGFNLSYGRFETVAVDAFVSGPVSDTLGFRLAAEYTTSGPWQKSYTSDAELGRQNKFTTRGTLQWEPAPELRVLLTGTAHFDRSESKAPQLLAIKVQNPQTPLPPGYLAYPLAPQTNRAADWSACINASPTEDPASCIALKKNTEYYQGSLRVDYDLSPDITISSLTSYQHYDRFEPIDLDGTTFRNYESVQQGFLKSFYQELRIAGSIGGDGNWIVGGNYQHDDTVDTLLQSYSDSSSRTIFGLPLGPTQPLNEQKIKTYAVFGNIEVPVGPVTLHGGARYTKQKRDFRGCGQDGGDGSWSTISQAIQNFLITGDPFFGGAFPDPSQGPGINAGPGGCGTTGPAPDFLPAYVVDDLDEDNLSWRVGAKWNLSADHMLYANLSRGYKAGAFPTAATARSVQLLPAVQESLLAYEAGIKSDFLDRRVQLSAAAYYYDYSNKQIRGFLLDPVFGPLAALVNVPKSRVKGFEANLTLHPVDGLRLGGNLSYANSRIKGDFSNFNYLGQLQNFTGEAFPHSPKWQATGNMEYRFPAGDDWEAYFGGNISYRGATNAGFGELPELKIKSYSLLDLRAGIDSGPLRFEIWGRNVTNTYYYSEVARLFGDSLVRFTGMPATYGITIGYKFGS